MGEFLKGDFCILRFNANGAVDSGFGSAGQVLTTVGNYGNMAYSIAVQPDGRGGAGSCGNGGNNSAADICVQRFTPEGALDTTFNGTGYVITPIGSGGFYFSTPQNRPLRCMPMVASWSVVPAPAVATMTSARSR